MDVTVKLCFTFTMTFYEHPPFLLSLVQAHACQCCHHKTQALSLKQAVTALGHPKEAIPEVLRNRRFPLYCLKPATGLLHMSGDDTTVPSVTMPQLRLI